MGLVLVAPSMAWAAIDRSIWGWDQSAYGANSIGLWATLRLNPGSWWDAMSHSLGFAPPVIVWVGQFFVPFRHVLGSDEAALLFAIEAALVLAIALLFAAGLRLTDGRRLALGSTRRCECSSTGRSQSRVSGRAHSIALGRLGALHHGLGEIVAPLPHDCATGRSDLVRPARQALDACIRRCADCSGAPPLASGNARPYLAALVAGQAVPWQRCAHGGVGICGCRVVQDQFQTAWDHAEFAATGTFWGRPASFGSSLSYWLHAARCAVPPYFDIALGALLLAGALVFLGRGARRSCLAIPFSCSSGVSGSVATALLLLASQVNDDKRFVAAALPAIALGLVAVLRILDEARITGIVVLLLAGQFALMTLHSFDVTASARLDRPGFYQAITVSKSAYAEQLDDIVLRTCTAESAQKYNTVGGSYASERQHLTML